MKIKDTTLAQILFLLCILAALLSPKQAKGQKPERPKTSKAKPLIFKELYSTR